MQSDISKAFRRTLRSTLPAILESKKLSYRPRGEMEQDPNFKQLIPYVLFRYVDSDPEHLGCSSTNVVEVKAKSGCTPREAWASADIFPRSTRTQAQPTMSIAKACNAN